MNINLNQLASTINKLYIGNADLTVFEYTEDNIIRASHGDVSYFFNYEKLQTIAIINNATYKENSNFYEILAKHISNQLSASRGEKVYPEILSTNTDYI